MPCMQDAIPTWAQESGHSAVAFAQVREDPALDAALIQPGDDVIMVASGGCTAAVLAADPHLGSLQLVDANATAGTHYHEASAYGFHNGGAEFLCGRSGTNTEQRLIGIHNLAQKVGVDCSDFAVSDTTLAMGLDYIGRYELQFAELRRQWQAHGIDEAAWHQAIAMRHCSEDLQQQVRAVFHRVMSQPILEYLFSSAACANRHQEFADHFFMQTMQALADGRAQSSPWFHEFIFGGVNEQVPDWLHIAPYQPQASISYHHMPMIAYLQTKPTASADVVHLSNITDWISQEEAVDLLQQTARVLRPGGRVIVRQLNSVLPLTELEAGITWDYEQSRKYTAQDRSFFYRHVWVGSHHA